MNLPLNQCVKVTRLDNGVMLSWYEGLTERREVFVTSGATVNRLAGILDIWALDENFPTEPAVIDLTQPESVATVAVEAYMPPGTPKLETGD